MNKLQYVVLMFVCVGIMPAIFAQVPQIPDIKWKEEQNFSQYNSIVENCAKWLKNTPLNTLKNSRKDINNFITQWSSHCTDFHVVIFSDIVKFAESDLLVAFIAGWCEYAIQTKDYDNLNCAMYGIDFALDVYLNNKDTFRKNKQAEKLIKLRAKGKLQQKIKAHIQ